MKALTPEILLRAYAAGIFPMSEGRDDPDLFWVDPENRGIIPLEGFHVARRLQRRVRSNPFKIRCNTSFAQVMEQCAKAAEGRESTWINRTVIDLYTTLQTMGHAHSVECWKGDSLVGGLYGITLGGVFFGESMFSRATDASKVALVHLVARLRQGGFTLFDVQFVTEHLKQFGTVEISRHNYHVLLGEALEVNTQFPTELMVPVESAWK
ncbi:MAG: leucyl/phenylalanyl-tRNA--protein transferase [Alphaproteobacteria bacterium]|nr:leucyl/phenylalanyl-tRNA--protein transferase [Alphaproteobacteria bacterium]